MVIDLRTLKTSKKLDKTRFVLHTKGDYVFFNSLIFPNYYNDLDSLAPQLKSLIPEKFSKLIDEKITNPFQNQIFKRKLLYFLGNPGGLKASKENFKQSCIRSFEAPLTYCLGEFNRFLPDQASLASLPKVGRANYETAVNYTLDATKAGALSYNTAQFYLDFLTMLLFNIEENKYYLAYSLMIRKDRAELAKAMLVAGEEIPSDWLVLYMNDEFLDGTSTTLKKHIKTHVVAKAAALGITIASVDNRCLDTFLTTISFPTFNTIAERKAFLTEYGVKMLDEAKKKPEAVLSAEQKHKLEIERERQREKEEAEAIARRAQEIAREEEEIARGLSRLAVGETMSTSELDEVHKLMREMEGMV